MKKTMLIMAAVAITAVTLSSCGSSRKCHNRYGKFKHSLNDTKQTNEPLYLVCNEE